MNNFGALSGINGSLRRLEELVVNEVLGPNALSQYQMGAIAHDFLRPYCDELVKLSSSYVQSNQSATTQKINSQILARAYALYYLPINFTKFSYLLRELGFADQQPLKVLDFGSGPGTASLALRSAHGGSIEFVMADSSPAMRELAKSLMSQWFSEIGESRVSAVSADPDLFKDRYDLIFLGNVLNELPTQRQEELVVASSNALTKRGRLVILEPALKVTTRRLMELRDYLLKQTALLPIYPCTHCNGCPMLRASSQDWCHGEIRWERPQLIRQLDQLTGFNKHRLKYSAMIMGLERESTGGFRVVEVLGKRKPGTQLSLCGENFYRVITIPKKTRSEAAKNLRKAQLHDFVSDAEANEVVSRLGEE